MIKKKLKKKKILRTYHNFFDHVTLNTHIYFFGKITNYDFILIGKIRPSNLMKIKNFAIRELSWCLVKNKQRCCQTGIKIHKKAPVQVPLF